MIYGFESISLLHGAHIWKQGTKSDFCEKTVLNGICISMQGGTFDSWGHDTAKVHSTWLAVRAPLLRGDEDDFAGINLFIRKKWSLPFGDVWLKGHFDIDCSSPLWLRSWQMLALSECQGWRVESNISLGVQMSSDSLPIGNLSKTTSSQLHSHSNTVSLT